MRSYAQAEILFLSPVWLVDEVRQETAKKKKKKGLRSQRSVALQKRRRIKVFTGSSALFFCFISTLITSTSIKHDGAPVDPEALSALQGSVLQGSVGGAQGLFFFFKSPDSPCSVGLLLCFQLARTPNKHELSVNME